MIDLNENLQKAQDLVDKYLVLLKKRNELEEEFSAHKKKIANMKTSKLENILLLML